jgi:uncharacterized protein (TIGR00159 family)
MHYLFNLTEVIATVKWHDWLDIFIVAFLLYRCFVLFWGTLVFRAIIVITLFWIFDLIATTLGLIVTSLILKGIGAIIVIIVIVIFRNEIRGVITSTNPLNLIWGKPRRKYITDYESISKAIFSLAENRVGALLVFLRKNSLDHLVQDGVYLGAQFSRKLLFSIFDNKSALHDGAVIMDGSQIQKAATFLPLTMQELVPLQYGTRHRAALGLSERSDAVVVVVSEERGTVSVVRESIIKEITNPEPLSRMLEMLLEVEPRKEKSNGLLRQLGRDAGVKIGFLLLAIFIWFFFAGERESLISFTSPIEFRNFPRNYELLSISADRAEVQISGSRRLLLQLKPDQIGLSLDMGDIKPGKNTFSLSRKNLSIPPGLDVLKIHPDELTIEMEEKKTKPIPVEPQWMGNLPEGKKLLSHKVLPESIVVIGTPSLLKELTSINTAPINLSGITRTETVEADLVVSGTAVRLSPDAPRKVRVTLEIGQAKKSNKKKKVKP